NWPEEDSKEAAIGRAFHAAAAQINQNLFDGQAVTIQQAMDMLESFWPQHGFKSAAERQKELKRAQAPLGEYLKREQAAILHPDLVEENFPFELGGGVVRVRGRFDAVYSRSPVEIRDYKTPQVTDQESADKKAAKSYQLGIYALAWQQSRGEIPGSLTLDFITSGLVGRSVRSQRQIDNTEK